MEKSTETGVAWERDVVENLLLASLKEQRSARRWKIFFRFLVLGYLVLVLLLIVGDGVSTSDVHVGNHTAVIDIDDVIGSDDAGITADVVLDGAKSAFESTGTKGVILRINSPGGSPVQSARIYHGLKRLREKHKEIPLYAVIEDIGASGAYYIASVADEIYANESSIVGSIGVIMNNFGFVEAMKMVGVERRMLTAGENKGALDPFSPLDPKAREHAQQLLDEVHAQFINAVKLGRGDRLADRDDLFSGLFWSGVKAKQYGLIDGFGDADHVARELVGEESLIDFTTEEDPFERFAKRLGMGMGETFKLMFTSSAAPVLH